MQTFCVSDVKLNSKSLATSTIDEAMTQRIAGKSEAAGADTDSVIQGLPQHGLLVAAHTAFQEHYPLVLSPDMIWLCIAQGFATHTNLNAEVLRDKFVKHQGKVKLDVRRDNFEKGAARNDWPGVFTELSNQIAGHIGKQRDLVVCGFSTTTPISRAASEITLLDAMQSYFEYHVYTRCGIPEITLLGTSDDWRTIRARAAALTEYGLDWWTQALLPVLDQFVCASEGNVDTSFWQSFYKWKSRSGGDEISGFVNTLFPYVKNQRTGEITKKNGSMNGWASGDVGSGSFPSGLSKAPFTWHYYGEEFPMVFIGGFAGATQETNGAVRPALGWAVADASSIPQRWSGPPTRRLR